MCGRYVSTRRPDDLVRQFRVTEWSPETLVAPNWNVAPTDSVWSIMEGVDRGTGALERQLRPLRWGLVPSWAKDPAIGSKMINARMETVHEKPAYRRAFSKRRCLLPADGYYEWVAVPATEDKKAHKQPYFISPEQAGQGMAFAGLYEWWRNKEIAGDDDPGAWLATCTIITTEATEATDAAGRIHPRMPLTITAADYDAWLDPEHRNADELRALLTSPADGNLSVRPVSLQVNSVRNNGPHLLDTVEPER